MTDALPTVKPQGRPDRTAAARPRRRVLRAFAVVIGWLCWLGAATGLVAHLLDTRHQVLIVLASAAWVLAPLSMVALVLHLLRRGWFAVVVTALLVIGQVAVYGPLFVAETAPSSPAATVRVLTQNMLYGEADATALVARIRAERVDVFAAQELTADAVDRLRAAGLEQLLPYSVLDARAESAGSGLWSRFPVSQPLRLAARGLPGVSAQLALPGGVSLTALSLHPTAPWPEDPANWAADFVRIRWLLSTLPAGPAFVGGDFNATVDHAPFRRLLVGGWRDGAEQAGAGLIRSWPSNRSVPAMIGIDHVLTRGTVATSVGAVDAPGSDHRGLLATVVVPR